ncbi:Pentatricopeptide repeat-containing protein At2g15630, mitochondrial, partial [Linum perenne]
LKSATILIAQLLIELGYEVMKLNRVLSSRFSIHKSFKTFGVEAGQSSGCHRRCRFSSAAVVDTRSNPTGEEAIVEKERGGEIFNLIQSSQWHSVEHLARKLSPSVISTTLVSLHRKPDSALRFVNCVGFESLDLKNKCIAAAMVSGLPSPKPALQLLKQIIVRNRNHGVGEAVKELGIARDELGIESSLLFDLVIRVCCDLKRGDDAFECYDAMKEKGLVPKVETCNEMLSLCLKMNCTEKAWVLYAEMLKLRIKSSVYTFNIMLNVLCKEGKLKQAKEFIPRMESLGVKPTAVTYNTLIHGYCSRGRFDGALLIVDLMKSKRVEPDAYTYGSLITGMCKQGKLEGAAKLLEKMKESGLVPTAVTYNILIDGYCNKGDLETAFRYKDEMIGKGIVPSVSTYNLLVHALLMEAKMGEAEEMVNEMRSKGIVPDSITYNILINGYSRCMNVKKAFTLLEEMVSAGIQPTRVTYTSLIYLLSKKNRMKEADNLFETISKKGIVPDRIMFNALIDGHCASGNMDRGFALLKEMDKMNCLPDEVTYNTLMQGRCREGKVEEARVLIDEMKSRGIQPDHISYNTLISGYSKRGDIKDALRVRDEMVSIGFNPTRLTYNALIQGLCKNQEGDLAEELLREMGWGTLKRLREVRVLQSRFRDGGNRCGTSVLSSCAFTTTETSIRMDMKPEIELTPDSLKASSSYSSNWKFGTLKLMSSSSRFATKPLKPSLTSAEDQLVIALNEPNSSDLNECMLDVTNLQANLIKKLDYVAYELNRLGGVYGDVEILARLYRFDSETCNLQNLPYY